VAGFWRPRPLGTIWHHEQQRAPAFEGKGAARAYFTMKNAVFMQLTTRPWARGGQDGACRTRIIYPRAPPRLCGPQCTGGGSLVRESRGIVACCRIFGDAFSSDWHAPKGKRPTSDEMCRPRMGWLETSGVVWCGVVWCVRECMWLMA
jgi:hypothetical protein